MGLTETDAIVLRSIKLGEADKIATLLTSQEGVVRGVARGARRLKSRFGASLEPFTLVRLTFFEKEARELVSITRAEITRSYFGLTRDDAVFVELEYLAGLILEFAPLRAPDERFYRMLRACLEALAGAPGEVTWVAHYCEVWTLKLAGFLPDLSKCQTCGKPLKGERRGVALNSGSNFECHGCANARGVAVSPEAFILVATALKTPPESWSREAATKDLHCATEVRELLRILIARALEREPALRPRRSA
ncbi:MAG TPA: DNA repair protein RecO [Pyrinomonadaceae bacterium]|jgi:DNA repair protein RecO (recombination protein O)|nr:DNA repair protein RecO [Pyrinomonadaceae bacterium]